MRPQVRFKINPLFLDVEFSLNVLERVRNLLGNFLKELHIYYFGLDYIY